MLLVLVLTTLLLPRGVEEFSFAFSGLKTYKDAKTTKVTKPNKVCFVGAADTDYE